MLFLGYLILFLIVIVVYIHVLNYYKINNDIDYVELYEPLKTDYEKVCKNKLPFTVLFENKDHFIEGKNALAPPLLYKKESQKIFFNKQNETIVFCEKTERNVIFITSNNISIKLFPPKSKDYLIKLKSSVWNTNILDNVKHLKIDLHNNSILVIPPFWYYSFKINNDITEKKDSEENTDITKTPIAIADKMTLDRTFYTTYPNLLGLYLEKCKSYVDEFLK